MLRGIIRTVQRTAAHHSVSRAVAARATTATPTATTATTMTTLTTSWMCYPVTTLPPAVTRRFSSEVPVPVYPFFNRMIANQTFYKRAASRRSDSKIARDFMEYAIKFNLSEASMDIALAGGEKWLSLMQDIMRYMDHTRLPKNIDFLEHILKMPKDLGIQLAEILAISQKNDDTLSRNIEHLVMNAIPKSSNVEVKSIVDGLLSIKTIFVSDDDMSQLMKSKVKKLVDENLLLTLWEKPSFEKIFQLILRHSDVDHWDLIHHAADVDKLLLLSQATRNDFDSADTLMNTVLAHLPRIRPFLDVLIAIRGTCQKSFDYAACIRGLLALSDKCLTPDFFRSLLTNAYYPYLERMLQSCPHALPLFFDIRRYIAPFFGMNSVLAEMMTDILLAQKDPYDLSLFFMLQEQCKDLHKRGMPVGEIGLHALVKDLVKIQTENFRAGLFASSAVVSDVSTSFSQRPTYP